jgi:gp16 family phage-associated protein
MPLKGVDMPPISGISSPQISRSRTRHIRVKKMPKATALTPQQVREQFRAQGITLSTWAAERGFRRQDVYRVMGGQYKAHYGRAHEIAVALGLKPNISSQDGNRQTARAA